ncbi:MAG: extracellular solute-binding protein [Hyphomicrobiales bacterium]|nr:extracellular solute-binding protein [Hyphomicrobiales bacterium]MDE2113336.1 extracellular solute-binding protein [Hyphomicrobiales bacterium]
MQFRKFVSLAALGLGLLPSPQAFAETTLHMMWYSDGGEGQVMQDLLNGFEKTHPDIKVVLDTVPYKAINESLPVQLAAGQGPDMARVTDLGGLARYFLDLRPLLKDPAYFDTNFGPFLPWMRVNGDTKSIGGVMTQMTVTGPFINKTLFDQAGVAVPGPKATWDDWAAAVKQVADKVKAPYPLAIDRSGHRFYGIAISMGSKVFDDKGEPAPIDDGFKEAAKRVVDWHARGVMSKELWGSVSGATYLGANDQFKNGQVVMYLSGSWQIPQFAKTIGNSFDWQAVPNPCGPAACSGMPGGAALVGLKETKHPKEVAEVLEYLASEPVLSQFYARSLFIPGHTGIAAKGLDYKTDSPLVKAALNVFVGQVKTTSPLAFKLQGYQYNRAIFNPVISRLGQVIVGEMSLEDAEKRIASDVAEQLAVARKK